MRIEVGANVGFDIYLQPDAKVVVVPYEGMVTLYDHSPEGVSALFAKDGFTLFEQGDDIGQKYMYRFGYPYKEMPVLKQWLQQQDLQWPSDHVRDLEWITEDEYWRIKENE